MKVLMIPGPQDMDGEESGIKRVIEAYSKYGPKYGIELVGKDDDCDIVAIHAGAGHPPHNGKPHVAILHGLYWTDDLELTAYELAANMHVIESVRGAAAITVPSEWVAETIRRDVRVNPFIVPHGVEVDEWTHYKAHGGYVLWNKNRNADVCDPYAVKELAIRDKDIKYVTTFAPPFSPENVKEIGVQPHDIMKQLVERAAVYLSTTKETFGIGVLEAMAAGVPVLGFAHGGNVGLVEHGVTGYLAKPGDIDDLFKGLKFCLQYRETLGANGCARAREYTWEKAVAALKMALVAGIQAARVEPSVSVVIPAYNRSGEVGRAIRSALGQTRPVAEVIVVDDGSPDDGATRKVVEEIAKKDGRVQYVWKENGGVATARNYGISRARGKYICCLDSDDALEPNFVEVCLPTLEDDSSVGIVYTGLGMVKSEEMGKELPEVVRSQWPGACDYDRQTQRGNQIPTCCVFRREMWQRLGGYRQRFAPHGAGEEDAEFWLRAISYGWRAVQVTEAPLFLYTVGGNRVAGNPEHVTTDWTAYAPWCADRRPPFPSMTTPRKLSHPVRQYDEPAVSVIIPVGPKHTSALFDALDSLESQTLRNWEVIVVDDTGGVKNWAYDGNESILTAYPYIRWVRTNGVGAGAARNAGARIARAPLLVFLDADDWLVPEALQILLSSWNSTQAISYSDYYGKAYIKEEDLAQFGRDVSYYDKKTGSAIILHRSAEYDCEKAQRQPDRDMYIWNLVTSIVPKIWHDQIGGFDETMKSWEDWDYYIRLARAGKCFVRIPQPLVVYRFYTGDRREIGLQSYQSLLEYMTGKREKEVSPMPCNCGKGAQSPTMKVMAGNLLYADGEKGDLMNDVNFMLCLYRHLNVGDHRVIGPRTRIDYGYRSGGSQFLVHKADVEAAPDLFAPVETNQAIVMERVEEAELPPPTLVEELQMPEEKMIEGVPQYPELQGLVGMNNPILDQLIAAGVTTAKDLEEFGNEKLQALRGVGPRRSKSIMRSLRERQLREQNTRE